MAVWMRSFIAIPALVLVTACGGDERAVAETTPSQPVGSAAPAVAGAPAEGSSVTPAAGGEVIEILMTMENGGSFEPAEVTANPGDVLRFVNVDNVHNVSFPAAKNPGASNLPAASAYLTTPGAAYEMPVELAPGDYTFQCDPHAAMGMVGTLTVAE
jgi:plastocyanin